MKNYKFYLAALLVACSSYSHAYPDAKAYVVTGQITSVSMFIPNLATPVLTTADPAMPGISGTVGVGTTSSTPPKNELGAALLLDYHNLNVSIPGGGGDAVISYAYTRISDTYEPGSATFDPLTRTFSRQSTIQVLADEHCTGSGAICAYADGLKTFPGMLDLLITFDADYKQFTGSGRITFQLRNGATIMQQFTLASNGYAAPVPAAGWLLGSGLLALAGTRRRKHASKSA